MSTRPLVAPALVAGMRAAVARVELVASQLAREAATPKARALALSVSQAVGDLDASIAQCAGSLRAAKAPSHAPLELAALVADLEERIGATLEARGIRWSAQSAARESIEAEPGLVRRLALLLVRTATGRLAGPGSLLFSADAGADGWSLTATLVRDRKGAAPSREGVEELSRFAAAASAGFEHQLGAQREVLRCAVVKGREPCGAS